MRPFLSLIVLSVLPLGAFAQKPDNRLPPPAKEKVDFVKDVQPIFQAKCLSCHGVEEQEGGSIFASGKHPGRQEVYTLVCNTDLKEITGLRIEAITDGRLPGGGPGRGPLGNFHLTRFDIQVVPADPVHINDLHATMLHTFGMDHKKLVFPFGGLPIRLTNVGGNVVQKLLT